MEDKEFETRVRQFFTVDSCTDWTCSRNAWIYGTYITCRFRNTQRVIEGTVHNTVEIANVCVVEEHQGKGIYADLLALMSEIAGDRTVYVESVLSRMQEDIYLRRGFNRVNENNFYKLPSTHA